MLDRPAGWIKKERARPTGRRSRMIPAPFAYHRPRSLDETLGLLAHHGEDARVVAGGHSLIPMMKLRLARPEHLVDLQDLQELRGILSEHDVVIIGAMTTQRELIGSELLTARCPIIREAALQIADPQVRYCGTLGGNVVNGDPGNDMPAVMMALNASGENQTFESYLAQPAVKAAPQGPIVRGGGLPMLVFGDLSPAAQRRSVPCHMRAAHRGNRCIPLRPRSRTIPADGVAPIGRSSAAPSPESPLRALPRSDRFRHSATGRGRSGSDSRARCAGFLRHSGAASRDRCRTAGWPAGFRRPADRNEDRTGAGPAARPGADGGEPRSMSPAAHRQSAGAETSGRQ